MRFRQLLIAVVVFGLAGATLIISFLVSTNLLFGRGVLIPGGIAPSPPNWVEMARSRIQLGDERNVAVQALSDAWYHADCRDSNGEGSDLFFYGPRNRTQSHIVVITSIRNNGRLEVTNIGSMENYLLDLYTNCVPPDIFANSSTATAQP